MKALPWCVGLFAAIAVILGNTPGLTWDEPPTIRAGVSYVSPGGADRWAPGHEHPPLAKILYGLAVRVGGGVFRPLSAARAVAATFFVLLVVLTSAVTARQLGPVAGAAAGIALTLMPQVLAHAHLAVLDLPMTLAWLAASSLALAIRNDWSGVLALGGMWGIALLTKINGFFVIVPMLVIATASKRLAWQRAPVVLAIGLATFIMGWPWLWEDTAGRLQTYLGGAVQRWVVPTLYLGRVYAEQYPPWHYPLVTTAATMPPTILAAIGAGIWYLTRHHRGYATWLSLNVAFTLGVACLPGVARYDGARLFLPAMPFLAMLAGAGAHSVVQSLTRLRVSRWITVMGSGLLLIMTASGLRSVDPCLLSYYSPVVGGLAGAQRLGLEATFWGDAITPELLATTRDARTVFFAPLEQDYAKFLGLEWEGPETADVIIILNRHAMLDPALRSQFEQPAVAEVRVQGVALAKAFRRNSRQ